MRTRAANLRSPRLRRGLDISTVFDKHDCYNILDGVIEERDSWARSSIHPCKQSLESIFVAHRARMGYCRYNRTAHPDLTKPIPDSRFGYTARGNAPGAQYVTWPAAPCDARGNRLRTTVAAHGPPKSLSRGHVKGRGYGLSILSPDLWPIAELEAGCGW